MITIKKLKLNNFLSHSSTELDFPDTCHRLISGKSGSGKSSLVEAIVFCFYGRGRSDNRSLIRKGTKMAVVTVLLQDDNIEYVIERKVDSKGKQTLNVSSSEGKKIFLPVKVVGTKALQNFIEKNILNSSYSLFINSVIFPQNSTESFVELPATRRKDLLLEIIGSADFDEYYDKTKNEIAKLELSVEGNKAQCDLHKSQIESNKLLAVNLEELEKMLKEKNLELAKIESAFSEIKDKKDSLKNTEWKLQSVNTALSAINESLEKESDFILESRGRISEWMDSSNFDDIDQQLKELEINKATLKTEKDKQVLASEWNSTKVAIMDSKPDTIDFESNIKEINRQLIVVLSKKIEDCPELKKPCPMILGEQQNRQKELEELLGRNTEGQADQEKMLAEYNEKIKSLGECPKYDYITIEDLGNKISKIEKLKVEYDTFKTNSATEVKKLEEKIKIAEENKLKYNQQFIESSKEKQALELEISGSENFDEKELELSISLSKINFDRDVIVSDVSISLNARRSLEKDEEKLKTIETTTKDINTKIEALGLLKEAFGSKGLKAMVLDYTIPRLEEKINGVLSKLSNFRIRLETQRSSATGESTIESLYINIINDRGETLDFNSFSGGERVKISNSIFEGLAGFHRCGFRVLDESIVSLDPESTSQFIEVLGRAQRSVNQLIVISHIPEIKECFEERIEVIKQNGISKVICS